jgi:hypothetical protein
MAAASATASQRQSWLSMLSSPACDLVTDLGGDPCAPSPQMLPPWDATHSPDVAH